MNLLEWLRLYGHLLDPTAYDRMPLAQMQPSYFDTIPLNYQFSNYGQNFTQADDYSMRYGQVPGTQDPGLLWYPDLQYWMNDPKFNRMFQYPLNRKRQS